jgi:hypothetical protein
MSRSHRKLGAVLALPTFHPIPRPRKTGFAPKPERVDEKPGFRPLFGSLSLDFFGVNAD